MHNHNQPSLRLIDSFRTYAAALVIEQGQQIGEVARRLGIDNRLLKRWIQAFGGTQQSPSAVVEDPDSEIARLRAERDALLTALRLALTASTGPRGENTESSPDAHEIPTNRAQTGSRQLKGRYP